MKASFRDYYELIKPGLVYGNAIPLIGGFFLASRDRFSLPLLAAALIGLSLVIASGCVVNNIIDRDIDAKMERTKERALVAGRISARGATVYATVLGLAGFLTLWIFTNALATVLAALGYFVYAVLYSLFAKRRSFWGTVVGSVSGAMPPVVGYCAVSGRFDLAAWLLFFILVLWQMPHFYAIGIYREGDYAAAEVPILPIKKGIFMAKMNIFFYVVAYVMATLALAVFGYTGPLYLIVAAITGCVWLYMASKGFVTADDRAWARRMFFLSLFTMTLLFAAMAVDAVL